MKQSHGDISNNRECSNKYVNRFKTEKKRENGQEIYLETIMAKMYELFLMIKANNQELQINLEHTIPEKTTQTHGSQDQNASIEVKPTLHQKE